MEKMGYKKKRSFRHISYILLIAFAIVSFWRGVWQLSDLYLFPDNPLLSNLISLIMGILILYLTKHMIDLE